MADAFADDAADEDGEAGDEEPVALTSKAGASKKKGKEKLFKVGSALLAGGRMCVPVRPSLKHNQIDRTQ